MLPGLFLPAQRARTACWLILLALALMLLLASPLSAQQEVMPEEVEALLAILEGDDLLAQEQAAVQLAEMGSLRAVPRLREIFLTADTPRPAAIALAGIGSPRALKTLAQALGEEQLTERRNAAQVALLGIGDRAVPALLAGLNAREEPLQRNTAELLGFIGSPRSATSLARLARQDEDDSVRLAAVWALGEINVPYMRGTLRAIARTDPNPAVRAEAQRATLRVGELF